MLLAPEIHPSCASANRVKAAMKSQPGVLRPLQPDLAPKRSPISMQSPNVAISQAGALRRTDTRQSADRKSRRGSSARFSFEFLASTKMGHRVPLDSAHQM